MEKTCDETTAPVRMNLVEEGDEPMHCRDKKVFGIGLARTATTSLTAGLEMLGFRSMHWPHDPTTRRELVRYLSGKAPFHLTVAEEYDAITDTPVACVFKELATKYPRSKFVLTVRRMEDWLDSCSKFFPVRPVREEDLTTVGRCRAAIRRKLFGRRNGDQSHLARFMAATRRKLYGRLDFDENDFRTSYLQYVSEVTDYFQDKPGRLLVIDICDGEGWDKLAGFLDCPVPDGAFPHQNKIGVINGKQPVV